MERKYYIYQISKPDGTPLYIGKGSGDRVYQHFKKGCSSNIHLQRSIKKLKRLGLDPVIDILHRTDDEQYAYELEKEEIAKYGIRRDGGLLCNMTYGGESPPKNGHQRRVWICLKAQAMLGKAPDHEIAKRFYYTKDAVAKFRRRLGIPSYVENKTGYVSRDGNMYDDRVHVIFNCITEEFFVGRRNSFVKSHGVPKSHASALFNNKVERYKDWMYCGTVDSMIREPIVDRSRLDKYVFKHKDGTVFTGLREEFQAEYGIKPSSITTLYRKNKNYSYKGWKLLGVLKCISEDGSCEESLSEFKSDERFNKWKNSNHT